MSGREIYRRSLLMLLILVSAQRIIHAQDQVSALPGEVLNIVSDRDIYIAGEEILIKIFVHDTETGLPSRMSEIAYLELLDRQNSPLVQGKFLLDKGEADGVLTLPMEIPSDHYILRAYTSWMKNFGADGYGYSGITAINPFEELRADMLQANNTGSDSPLPDSPLTGSTAAQAGINITIGSNPTGYGPRQNAALDINLKDEEGKPVEANLVVSIVRQGLCGEKNPGLNIPSKEDPGPVKIQFPPEWGGHFITGNISSKNYGNPFDVDVLLLSITGKNPALDYTKADVVGNFSFLVPHFSGSREIVIQHIDPYRTEYQIRLEDMFSAEFSELDLPDFYLDTNRIEQINQAVINAQIWALYSQGIRNGNGTFGPERPFYGSPDRELILAEYIKLPDMREVFFELLPSAQIRGRGDEVRIRMKNFETGEFFPEQPMLFVDGVVTRDPRHIEKLNPLKAERIDLINGRYYLGSLYIPGIINVVTQDGMCPLELPSHFFRQSYDFISRASVPKFPVYHTDSLQNSPRPDYRNTLYWDPDITTGSDGKAMIEFYTSDDAAEYIVSIAGFTSTGIPVSYRDSFIVHPR